MIKRLFIPALLCILLTAVTTKAQSWRWANGTTRLCTGQNECNAVTTDRFNNVYVSGHYGDSLYLGSYTFFQTFLTAVPSIWQSFFAKYDSAGNLLWVKTPTLGLAQTWSVRVGPDNCLYAWGTYTSSTLSFGGGAVIYAPNPATEHYFLAKFDAAGNVTWIKNIGEGVYGLYNNFWIKGMDCDQWGGIYVTGEFRGSVYHIGSYVLSSLGIGNTFVAKFDTAGNVKWAKSLGGSLSDYPHDIAVSNAGGVYVVGNYNSPVFYASPSVTLNYTSLAGGSVDNTYIVKLDTSGNVLWARSPTNGCNALTVTTDQHDNAIIGGVMEDQLVTFGYYTVFDVYSSSATHAAFVAKYDPNGTAQWANPILADAGQTIAYDIKVDNCNNIWVSGGGIYPGPHTLFYDAITSVYIPSGATPMFFAGLDGGGNLLEHQEFPSGFNTGLACDNAGNVLLTGNYAGPLTFGTESLLAGGSLFFLAKYRPATISPDPIAGPFHICQGSSLTLSDATTAGTWSSSDLAVAQVIATTGVVKGVLAGAANISYTLTDGCSVVAPFIVDLPVPATINLTRTLPDGSRAPDTLCLNTTVTFKSSPVNAGLVPFFQWYRFDTLKASGFDTVAVGTDSFVYTPAQGDVIYCKMVVDGVCAVSDTVTDMVTFNVDSNKPPLVTITKLAAPDTLQYLGQTITFYSAVQYGGTTPTYQWYINRTAVPGATAAYFATPVYANDTVYCLVSGNPPCAPLPSPSVSNEIIIYDQLAVTQVSNGAHNLSLFPNPSNGTLLLSGKINPSANSIHLEINDMLGRIIYSNDATPANGQLHEQITLGNNVANGAYLLHVNPGDGDEVLHFVIAR